MQLRFSKWHSTPHRNETELEEAFQLAIQDAIDPANPRDRQLSEVEYDFAYEYGAEEVDFLLSGYLESDGSRRLRYGEWATALTGLDNCRLAYPGLSWYFGVWMFVKGEEQEPEEFSWGCVGVKGGACFF